MDRGTQTGGSELDYDIVSIPDSYPDSNDSAAVNHHLTLSYDPDEDVRLGSPWNRQPRIWNVVDMESPQLREVDHRCQSLRLQLTIL